MSVFTRNGEVDETAWIKAYIDSAGVTESQARNVFMYVGCKDFAKAENDNLIELTVANQLEAIKGEGADAATDEEIS